MRELLRARFSVLQLVPTGVLAAEDRQPAETPAPEASDTLSAVRNLAAALGPLGDCACARNAQEQVVEASVQTRQVYRQPLMVWSGGAGGVGAIAPG